MCVDAILVMCLCRDGFTLVNLWNLLSNVCEICPTFVRKVTKRYQKARVYILEERRDGESRLEIIIMVRDFVTNVPPRVKQHGQLKKETPRRQPGQISMESHTWSWERCRMPRPKREKNGDDKKKRVSWMPFCLP